PPRLPVGSVMTTADVTSCRWEKPLDHGSDDIALRSGRVKQRVNPRLEFWALLTTTSVHPRRSRQSIYGTSQTSEDIRQKYSYRLKCEHISQRYFAVQRRDQFRRSRRRTAGRLAYWD